MIQRRKDCSLILSWNSTTFKYSFNDRKMSTIEMKDFSKGVLGLKTYLECLYIVNVKSDLMPVFRNYPVVISAETTSDQLFTASDYYELFSNIILE